MQQGTLFQKFPSVFQTLKIQGTEFSTAQINSNFNLQFRDSYSTHSYLIATVTDILDSYSPYPWTPIHQCRDNDQSKLLSTP